MCFIKKDCKDLNAEIILLRLYLGEKDGWYITKNGIKYRFHAIEKEKNLIIGKTKELFVFLEEKTDKIVYFTALQVKNQFIKYIPDKEETNMKTRGLIITPPEGYEVDKEKSTFEKIVFKPIDFKPKSWKEYCDKHIVSKNDCFINGDGINKFPCERGLCYDEKNTLPSKELAEAFFAMMQLMSLRQAWIGDWIPDWTAGTWKFVVQSYENTVCIGSRECTSSSLSFPTKEMAQDFLICFKDLIEQAKILL